MKDYEIYALGLQAGYRGDDSRSCPFEETSNILDWLEGYNEGRAKRLEN